MMPPRPRSKLGESVALNCIDDVKTSLITPTVVLRTPVVTVDVLMVELVMPPPPAMLRVEKLPTPAEIVPEEIVDTFRLEIFARPALSVEADRELRFSELPRAKLETLSVETFIVLARRVDTVAVEMNALPVLILLAFIELMLSGSVMPPPPPPPPLIDDTLMVEKLPTLASICGVSNCPVYTLTLKGRDPCVMYPAQPVLAAGAVAWFPYICRPLIAISSYTVPPFVIDAR